MSTTTDPDPGQTGPAQTGPAQTGPAQTGPAQTGPAQTGPAQAGPAQAGQELAAAGRAGPARAGPGQAGQGRAGVPQAVTTQAGPRETVELRVMPWWFVLLGLLVGVLLGWLVLSWLLGEADRAGQADTRAQLRVDAIRTGLTVVAGTGGGVALLLAARRQWINERAQRHRELVAAQERAHKERVQGHAEASAATGQRLQERQARIAEHDATERRVTELYTKAVDLLGGGNAAVRLGGLYALERLAADNEKQRAPIVAVVCAYLRMRASDDDPQETEVRRSAQRLLTRHLHDDDEATYWPGIRLDLAGAQLTDFDASGCTLLDADFSGAVFRSRASFARAEVRGHLRLSATFETATFEELSGDADIALDDARFTGEAWFDRADFGGAVSAQRTQFGAASFAGVTFRQSISLDRARFDGRASFRNAVFVGGCSIEHAEFARYGGFRSARFEDMALFRWTVFRQDAYFENALFAGAMNFARAEFHGRASFEGATLRWPPQFDQARATASMPHIWPSGTRVDRTDGDWLVITDPTPATR